MTDAAHSTFTSLMSYTKSNTSTSSSNLKPPSPDLEPPSSHTEDTNSTSDSLRKLCHNTTWTDGLWLQCHSRAKKDEEGKKTFHGGINNVRNRLQSCFRLAIDAGAGVVIPTIASRNQTALRALGGGELIPASRYWDIEYLVDGLKIQCPQLKIRFDLKGISEERRVPGGSRHYKGPRYSTNGFREEILSYLGTAKVKDILATNPVAVSFGDTFLAWDYEASGELSTIRKDLFRIITYNQTLMDIGSRILASPQLRNGYIGVHLRGERDWPHHFGNWHRQMQLYIQEVEDLNRSSPTEMRDIYVSCGNATVVEIFRDRVTKLGYMVHDKHGLLANDLAKLALVKGLMFDEKAAVEYLTLLNSNFFMGPAMSSMSSLIAYTRAINETTDFFSQYIYPGSKLIKGANGRGIRREYPHTPIMKGTNRSRLMVVNGDDIMPFFP